MQMSDCCSRRVIAVVVTFNADKSDLGSLLDALLSQVEHIVVVDNASLSDMASALVPWRGKNVELLQMPENFGIAAAQNAGIERAMALDADFVLLSDQDSHPPASMVSELLGAMIPAGSDKEIGQVAAVGPTHVDRRTGQASFFLMERSGIPRRSRSTDVRKNRSSHIEVSFLMASGTLIPIQVIKKIGGMRSSYFIDHVDTEWCFRAKAAGFRLIGIPACRLAHRLGDSVSQVWFFGNRQVMHHSPLRDYYMFRNTILMLRDTPMSFIWRFYFLWRLVQFAGYFLVFSENRRERCRLMCLGLMHGFAGTRGRLETDKYQCNAIPVSNIEQQLLP